MAYTTLEEFRKQKKEETQTTSFTTLDDFRASRGVTTDVMSTGFVSKPNPISGFLHHGARNNNPGNLKFAGQPGARRAPDSDFAQFPTVQAGFHAMQRDLLAKIEGRSSAEAAIKIGLGENSPLRDLIHVYAPPTDNNPTANYIQHVADKLGVTADTKLKDIKGRLEELALAMVEFEDRDHFPQFLAQLTGAPTAQAQAPQQKAAEEPATVPQTSGGMYSLTEWRNKRITEAKRYFATLEGGYHTDVLGHGLVFQSAAQEVDPSLPTPDSASGTANSTKMFITPEEGDAKSILPRGVRDARDIVFKSMVADTYLSIMNTAFTGVRALTDQAIEEKGPWEEGGRMEKFDQWLDEKVNIPLNESMKKHIEIGTGIMESNALRYSDNKENISSWRETLYAWGNTFGSMGTAIGVWAVTRSPKAAAAFLATMEASNVYNEARDTGKSADEALKIAAASGVGTYLLEKWGITVMGGLAGSKTLSQWTINGIKAGFAETAQEEAQTVWQNVVKKYGYDESQGIFEGWYDTAIATFAPSMVMNMILPSSTRAVGRSDILKDIQDKAGVDQDTANRTWKVMQYATEDFLNAFRLRGLEIEDVSGAKSTPDLVLGDEKAPGAERFNFTTTTQTLTTKDVGTPKQEMWTVFGKKVGDTDTEIRVEFTNQDGQRVIQVIPKDKLVQEQTGSVDYSKIQEVEDVSDEIISKVGNEDGTVTLYHAATPELAAKIRENGFTTVEGGDRTKFGSNAQVYFQIGKSDYRDSQRSEVLTTKVDRDWLIKNASADMDGVTVTPEQFQKDTGIDISDLDSDTSDLLLAIHQNNGKIEGLEIQVKREAAGEVVAQAESMSPTPSDIAAAPEPVQQESRRVVDEMPEETDPQTNRNRFDENLFYMGVELDNAGVQKFKVDDGTYIGTMKRVSTWPVWIPATYDEVPYRSRTTKRMRTRKVYHYRDKRLMDRAMDIIENAGEVKNEREAKAVRFLMNIALEGVSPEVANDILLDMERSTDSARTKKIYMGLAEKVEGAKPYESVEKTIKKTTEGKIQGESKTLTPRQLFAREIRRANKTGRTVKRTERKAASRQVQFEKREAKRQLVKQRAEILQDIRDQNGTREERLTRLRAYARENIKNKADLVRAQALINGVKTVKGEIKAFARMTEIIRTRMKKDLRENILNNVKKALASPTVAIEYKKKIAVIIEHYELRGHTDKTMKRLENLRTFIETKIAEGEEVTLPTEVVDSIQTLFRKPFADISVREMQNIDAKITHLDKIGRLKRELETNKYEKEVETIREELTKDITPIDKIKKFEAKPGEPLTRGQRMYNHLVDALNQLHRIDMVLTPVDVLMDILDGAKGLYNGAHMQMKRVLDNNFGWYLDLKDMLTGKVWEMASATNLKEENFERMGIVAARDQDGGMEKLKNNGYTEEEVNAIKLTKDEQVVLDEMRKVMDSQFPWVQAIMRDLYNEDVKKVKNYFSFMTDFAAMEDMPMQQRFEDRAALDFKTPPKKTISHKFAVSRKGAGKQKIKVNAMQVFSKHIDDVAYFRAMAKDTKQFFEAVNSPEYAEKAGIVGQQLVVEWLDVVARKGGSEGANQIHGLDMLRRNVSAGILGLKLSTIAIQPTALIDGMGMISPGKALWGMEQVILNADARRYVLERFPELRDRTGGEVAIRELLEDSFWIKMQRRGFMPMQYVDKITAASIALGAYKAKMEAMGKEVDYTVTPDPEAMAYAELVTRRTQASSLFKDLPLALSRGNLTGNRSIDRAILQFQTFLLYRWSRVRHDAIRVGISTKSPKQVARAITPIIFASMAASGIRMGLREAMAAVFGGDDDEEKKLADEFARGMWYELSGTVPFVGQFWGVYMYSGGAFPIMDAITNLPEDLKPALTAKEPESRRRAWARVITDATLIAGVPGSVQAQQIAMDVMPKANEKKTQKPKSKVFGGGGNSSKVFGKGGSSKVFGKGGSSKVFNQ